MRVCTSAIRLISVTENMLQHPLLDPAGVGISLKGVKLRGVEFTVCPVKIPAPDLRCLLVCCELMLRFCVVATLSVWKPIRSHLLQ